MYKLEFTYSVLQEKLKPQGDVWVSTMHNIDNDNIMYNKFSQDMKTLLNQIPEIKKDLDLIWGNENIEWYEIELVEE
jgi:hypothetical protein